MAELTVSCPACSLEFYVAYEEIWVIVGRMEDFSTS